MSAIIEVDNLGRYFGEIKAVDGISFKVQRGEVLGFLGPNGAGKSTTMKMLTCFLTPSFGRAQIGGYDIENSSREVRSVVGYLPENAPLYGEMEVLPFLDFVAEVRGLSASGKKTAIDRAISLTSLSSVVNQRIETLSKGFKRRVGLAQALIHDPEILILDEPTDGLDPNQKHEVRELIRLMAKEKCIVLSTHILEEVEEVCSRVVIIAKGKIVADETPDALRSRSKQAGIINLELKGVDIENVREILEKIPSATKVTQLSKDQNRFAFSILPKNSSELMPAIIAAIQQHNWQVEGLSIDEGKLDDVFRQITK